jgi:hypothetical protein
MNFSPLGGIRFFSETERSFLEQVFSPRKIARLQGIEARNQ